MAKIDSISPNSAQFASLVPVTRKIDFGGLDQEATVNAEYFDRKKCSPEDIAELCCREGDIIKASSARLMCDPPAPESAIYLIGPRDRSVCKIGVAMNPAKRLAELQVGCWEELHTYALFWFIEGRAYGVEKLSHRIADKMGKRLRGEWVDMDPGGAAYIVGSVIHSTMRVKVADSMMWLRQRMALMALRWSCEPDDNDVKPRLRKPVWDAIHTMGSEPPSAIER
jgi:hypothetical protein